MAWDFPGQSHSANFMLAASSTIFLKNVTLFLGVFFFFLDSASKENLRHIH